MTRIGSICEVLGEIDEELKQREEKIAGLFTPVEAEAIESLEDGLGYTIGLKDRSEDMIPSIGRWVDKQRHDDAVKVCCLFCFPCAGWPYHTDYYVKFFIPQLRIHLLSRILGSHERKYPNLLEQEISRLQFHRDHMYHHNTLRINYTSYDVLRQQDVLNPATPRCFILLPADPDESPREHPFLYAKVLGVYHASIIYCGSLPRRIDFFHVPWLYYDYERPGGWDTHRLVHMSYERCRSDQGILHSFDFVDPNDVIRATHAIPDFQSGLVVDLLNNPPGRWIAHDSAKDGDWRYYYINRCVPVTVLFKRIENRLR
jgi:hypothetical protein